MDKHRNLERVIEQWCPTGDFLFTYVEIECLQRTKANTFALNPGCKLCKNSLSELFN